MNIVYILSICLCIVLSAPAFAGEGAHPAPEAPLESLGHPSASVAEGEMDEFSSWMESYYQHPSPDKVPAMLRRMLEADLIYASFAAAPLIAFGTEVFRTNPDKVAAWCQELRTLAPRHAEVVIAMSAYAGSPATSTCAQILPISNETRAALPACKPLDLLHMKAKNARDLDMLWGAFFATGDSRAVHAIIDTLAVPTPDIVTDKGEIGVNAFMLVKMAATWSLGSLAREHSRVADIVRQRLQKPLPDDTPEVQNSLQEIVNKLAP